MLESTMENPFAVHVKEQYLNIHSKYGSRNVVELELLVKNKGEHFLGRLRNERKRDLVPYRDIFKPVKNDITEPIRRVLIEGGAGMGKTTLCISLFNDWVNGEIFTEYELLLFLPLCEKKVGSASSLFELIESLELKVNSQKLVSYVQDKRGGGLLVIADGWNHLSESECQVGSFFHSLLFGNTLSLASVIVTSRPTASAILHNDSSNFVDRFIEVCGFNRESIEDHVRSEFASAQPHTAADADGLLARIDCNPELHSVPISCTKLCQLWHTPKAFPTTMADLCTKIVLCILRHEKDFEIHSSENTSNSSLLEIINALPKDMQDSWWCLCKLALQTIDRNKLSLTQLGGSFQCGMMTFGLIEYDSTGVPDASLNFTHPTVKEYLAATCLVKHPSLDRTPIDMLDSICISGVAPPMFWTYLFKLAHQNVLEHALKIMSAHHVPKCIFCRCAYEAKNDVITSEVVKCLSTRNDSKTFVNFGNPRSVYDFDAMLYVVDNMKHYQCDGIEINCHKVLSTNCAISYNQIRTLVAMLLKQNTLNIRSLDLSNNSLQDETVADLFLQAASAFTSLEQLFVSNNSISTNGISAIISSTRRLTELDLSFNPLTKESLTILSDAIQSRTCTLEDFEILIMQGCLADDVDANITCLTTLIGNLMRYCVRFQKIDISGNYFKLGKPGNSDVHKMFKQVGGKFTLCFDDHYMTEDNVLLVAKIKEASMKTKTIDYTVAHGVFVGPGRSGKNSLMNRLLGKGPPGPNDKSPSTGVLESVVKAEVTVSELTNDIQWIQLDYDDEALELMMTAAKHNSESDSDSKANAMDGNSSSRQHFLQSIATTNEQHDSGESEIIIDCATTPDDSSTTPDDAEKVYVYEEAPLGEDPTRDDATALEIVNKPQPVPCTVKSIEAESLDVFKRAIKKHNMSAIRRRFETLWTLYLSNTGGQMEFQELLPLLVCGPSVFFITFPLNHDLDKPYDVCAEFEGRSPTRYRSSHTLLDEILQTVATIAALDSCGPYTLEAAKPKIFFVGTHKDQLSPESRSSDIQRIDKQLHERIKQTSLYDPILVGSIEFAIKDERLIFPVDNLDNDDTDFRNIRMRLHRIVKCDSKEFTISCPCPSLIFSLVLRAKHRTDQVLSYRDCFSIAERCGIRDLQEFHKALSFIHYRLGLIRYFSKDEFNEFVIIDPQILYNTITEVMNTTFQNQGILSLELINQENKLKVPLKWLLQVLEHLGIAASLDKHGKKCNYFFPAVLCHAQHRESPTPTESAGRLPPPILIAFESGFCPRGIAVRLIVHLLTNEKWELQPEGVFRNEICLSAGPCDIILKISCTHLELVFDPEWEISDLKDSKLKGYCADVFSQLREAMQIVINNYRNCSYFFALYCERSACKDRHPHPAKIKENSKTMWLSCTITNKRANFPRNWFGGILSMNEVISDKHIGRIADTMPEWEGSNADALDLTPTDVNAIKTEYSKKLKLQNRGALMRWREKCGANATYNNLIGVFEYADNNTLADFVKNLEPEVRMEFQKSFGGNTCSQTSHLPPEYPKVECKTIYVLKEAEPCLDSTHDSEDASMSASEKSHLMETEESKCPANDQNLQLYATNPVRDSCDSAVVDTADQQVKDTELRSDMEQPVQTKNSTSNVQYDSTKPGMESQSDSEHSTPSSEESRDSGTSILVISDKSVQGKFSQNTSSTMHPEEGRSVDDVEHTTKGTEQHIQLQPGDVSGHCIEPENKICSDRSQTGSRPVASGTASDVSHALTTSVDDRNQVEDKITKQTDSETLKLTQRHFQEAMKYGKASTSIMKSHLMETEESKCPANDQNLQLYATNPVRDSCDSAVVDTADQQVKDTEQRSDMEQPVQTKNSTSNVQYDSTKPGMESQSDSEHSTPSSEESRDSGTSILVISDKSVQGKFSQNTSSTMHPEEGRSVDDVEHTTKGTEQHIQLQPGDVSGHCIEPENKICSDRSQTGSRPVASGTASDVSHALTTSVDDRNQVEDKITKQTDSETLKLTQRHFQEAMKYGKASTSIMKVVLFGLPESGKTCTKHIILDEEPPQEYTSTPLALRPVTTHYVDITPGQWRKLSRRERDEIVATACQCYSSRRVEVKPLLDVVPSEEMPEEGRPTEPDTPSMRDPVEEPNVADMATLPHAAPVPTSGRAAPIRNAPKPKREAAAVLYPSLQTQQNLLDCLDKIQVKDRVFKIKRVQISDCGSQSQFHEILPVFIRGTTLFLYVFKLNEALSSKPMIKYYDKGKPICDDYQGTETYEQILEHCLRVVRSQKATGEKPPQIMIIGTHKDKEQECESETRETKNKKLAKLLLPEFKSEVKYYRQLPTEVIFPINARNPGDEEKKIAAEIRRLIEIDCEAKAVDIPLQWLGLESLLEDLTKACGRDVILKSELFAAARSQLYIKDESALDAALDFLHEHNLVFYYPEILPDVVFANAQVLLNKVTELVRAAHKGTTSYTLQGELWQRFCNYALVSEVFLAQKEFQKYYIPDVFNHKHLMELFIKLLIFAPLSATEVFVPVILKKLTKQELSEHRVTTMSPCASLVLTFRIPSHGGPLLGVFCATVGALLSEDNVDPCRWKLTMDSEDEITPSCLKRNCVQFSIEGHPGTVTIIDSFQYIEVHIHLSPQGAAASIDDLPAFCKMIRRSLFQALRKATLALNYNYSPPVIGFGCCCGDPTFHLASISANKKLWMCKKGVYSNRLNKSQLMWLEDNEKVDEVVSPVASIPVLHELDLIASREKEVRVMKIVTPHWERFSYRLHLRRETISTIKKDNPQREDDACQAMFNMWLNGEGRKPVSWGTLITALNEAELSEHAQDLGDIITQK